MPVKPFAPSADFIVRQLASVPLRNASASLSPDPNGGTLCEVPLEETSWRGLLGAVLPVSRERRVAVDALGAEVLGWCDGSATVGDLIERHRLRHELSFFESRALLLGFLELMMRRGILVMQVPSDEQPEGHSE